MPLWKTSLFTECDCNSSEGVDASVVCATYGGQCSCLDGVTGLQCDECMNGWFNLTTSGCTGRCVWVFVCEGSYTNKHCI